MGQARKTCPSCGRQPGSPHEPECPRSSKSVKNLQMAAATVGLPRVAYPGKGAVVASFEDVDGTRHRLVNRGVPLVTQGEGKTPFQGGLPKGVTPDDLADEVAFFRRGMELQQARQDALRRATFARPPEDTDEAEIAATYEALGLSWPKYRAAVTAAQEQGEAVVVMVEDDRLLAVSPEGGVTEIDSATMTEVNEMADVDFNEAEARVTAHMADAEFEDGTVLDLKSATRRTV